MKRKYLSIFRRAFLILMCLSLVLSPADLQRLALGSDSLLLEARAEDSCFAEIEQNDEGIFTAELLSEGVRVLVSFTEEANIPEGSLISMREISSDTQEYSDYLDGSLSAINDGLESEEQAQISHARFFDIGFVCDGQEIEPEAPVSVEISCERPDLDYESLDIVSNVVHFVDEQAVIMESASEPDLLPTGEESETLSFETESFSAYGVLFYHVDDNYIGDLLDGMSFGLVSFTKQETETNLTTGAAALMGAYKQNSRLDLKVVSVYPASQIESDTEFTHYVMTDDDITLWTFTWIEDNKYYVTTQVDGVTKYLSLYSQKVKVNGSEGGKVELLDEPNEYSVITVLNNGTDTNDNKLRLVNKDGWSLNRKGGNNTLGYQTSLANNSFSDVSNYFVPCLPTEAELKSGTVDPSQQLEIHIADKVSVSDTINMTDGAMVVVYSKIWDSDSQSYVNYAINGNGELVKVWESGGVVQWMDYEDTSLYWQFIQYDDTGYYEFYNPVTGMYLAPQNGQLLSNSPIGVTLNGRQNGEYSSTLVAWDSNVWSWYGYKYSNDLTLIPIVDTQSAEMCFAVKDLHEDGLHQVETVDSKAAGITIKMYDYVNATRPNTILGDKDFTGDGNGARTGLVRNVLEGGYPVAVKTGTSLEELFTSNSTYPEREANHLFLKPTYDETGYYEYSCFDTSAFLMQEDGTGAVPSAEGYPGVYDFSVYQELVSPGSSPTKKTYWRGNFLPYDMVDVNDRKVRNLYDGGLNPLPADDPRYNENIYVQQSPDYYFGLSLETTFMIPENGCDKNGNPLIFEFNGDDDFWLFIDDVLVIDLGGIHNALTGKVDFSTGIVSTYNGYNSNTYSYTTLMDSFRNAGVFPDGSPWDESQIHEYFKDDGSFQSGEGIFKDFSSHTMKIFYMERGAGASNLKLRFNLATVSEKSVFLEKKLTGTQTTDYSNTKYAYQLYYKPEGSEDYILYANPDDESQKAHIEGQSRQIQYESSAEINGQTYDNVFFLRSGEKAEFTMPSKEAEYYFVELGVFNQEYDYVNINSQRAFTSDFAQTHEKDYVDVSSTSETIANRKRVIYENHIDPDYLKKLIITKEVVDKDGNPVEGDKTGFEFQVGFVNDQGVTVPYQKGEYYVMDDDGNYYVYVNGKLSKHGKEKAVCSVSGNNGSIAGIPDGLSVVIEELIPQTIFKVEELDSKMPLGYQWKSYDRVFDEVDGATYNLIDSGVNNIGEIRENINAHMTVTNQKGFGITVNKKWKDDKYTSYHDTIYIALFKKGEGDQLIYVEDTFRELVSPNTSMYYFNDEQEASQYVAMEVRPETIVPADWNGDTTVVTDCQPYLADSTTTLSAQTLGGEEYDFHYSVDYEQGEITGTGHNIRTDSIINSRNFLRILKQSVDGDPLGGARFDLTDITSGEILMKTLTSGDDGFVDDAYFVAGHSYRLDEIAAPNGYLQLSGPITINVSESDELDIQYTAEDAENISVELSPDRTSGTLLIKNKPRGLLMRKVDSQGEHLSGAVFTVYQFDRGQNKKYPLPGYQNVVSDENGVFFSDTLPSGYYLIEEVKAPNGFATPEESTVIHIKMEDRSVDRLYTVRYDSGTGTYVTVKDVLSQQLYADGQVIRVDFPNEKITGNLILRKTIDGIDASKGYPTFTFKITQTKDENGNALTHTNEYIRTISFDSTDTDPTKEITVSGLPIGTYIVQELSTLNYTLSGLTVEGDSHAIITDTNAAVSLVSEDLVTVAFSNRLNEETPPGYVAFADNKISYPAQE